ncbi:MAG: FtsQ-type POTRA domain-containing protein, partial [bacterium]|nr:FtsQ-type POTRA domain-containing protein [bacterium]
AVHSEPVRDIVLITDGVLNQQWVNGTLALPKTASLMALDLPALRDRLLQGGQVRGAVLSRNFPDALVVTVQERTPVARVQVSAGAGSPQQLLVAKDGVVYDGLNYDKQMLATLPWLDGVRLVRHGGSFEPIAGMADVAALLSMAQLQAPNLYRDWLIVSLARLADRDEIVVKAQDIPEIVFTRKRDYFKQIAQLDYVVDAARSLPEPTLQSVNLSLDGQVPVRLTSTPDELQKAVQPSFQLNHSPRKAKRDL